MGTVERADLDKVLHGATPSQFISQEAQLLTSVIAVHDMYYFKGGWRAWAERPAMLVINVLTILAGAFICVGGLYATIKALQVASDSGALPSPFQC
jgi:hypothetical protein